MLKTEYNRMNEKISPDAALNACIMEKIAPRQGKAVPSCRSNRSCVDCGSDGVSRHGGLCACHQ